MSDVLKKTILNCYFSLHCAKHFCTAYKGLKREVYTMKKTVQNWYAFNTFPGNIHVTVKFQNINKNSFHPLFQEKITFWHKSGAVSTITQLT